MTAAAGQDSTRNMAQLAGPRYRPGAFDLVALSADVVKGHQAIAEKVREHAEQAAQDRQAAAEQRAAERHAEQPAAG